MWLPKLSKIPQIPSFGFLLRKFSVCRKSKQLSIFWIELFLFSILKFSLNFYVTAWGFLKISGFLSLICWFKFWDFDILRNLVRNWILQIVCQIMSEKFPKQYCKKTYFKIFRTFLMDQFLKFPTFPKY